MGCQKLDTDFCNFLEIAYSEKRGYGGKKCVNYYSFGLKHKGYNNVVNGQEYPYGFVGKEENDELGLEWLDFGARNYDASLGRWMNLDPLAELMRRHSPYNYAFDNPVYFIDPDGRAPLSNRDPIKKQKSYVQYGAIKSTNQPTDKYGNIYNLYERTIPKSNINNNGYSKETYVMKEDHSADKFLTGSSIPELSHSLSIETTTVSNRYFDADGNPVQNLEDASTFTTTTKTKKETINFKGIKKIETEDTGTVTTTMEQTTFDVSTDINGNKHLTNPNTISDTDTRNVDVSDMSEDIQNQAGKETTLNVIEIFKYASDKANNTLQSFDKKSFPPSGY